MPRADGTAWRVDSNCRHCLLNVNVADSQWGFSQQVAFDEDLHIIKARRRYDGVGYTDKDLYTIAALTSSFNVDGHRADLVILNTARAQAAFEGRDAITDRDILMSAELALPHRMKKQPFQDTALQPEQLEANMRQARAEAEENEESMEEADGDAATTEKKVKRVMTQRS